MVRKPAGVVGTRYTQRDLFAVRAVSGRLVRVLHELVRAVRPGVTGDDLNAYALHLLREHGLESAVKGYGEFPAALAVSPNAVAAHGVPGPEPLLDGSIVSLDLGVVRNGWHADAAVTVPVGRVSRARASLIQAAYACSYAGIRAVRAGCDITELGDAVQAEARRRGVRVVSVCGGHGVGRSLHESPHYRYEGMPEGLLLKPGNIITVEPVVVAGSGAVRPGPDGHALLTVDGQDAAQFEHTVYVSESGPVILTEAGHVHSGN